MKKICRLTQRTKQRRRGLCAGGMALLLLVMVLLPTMPVYAEENLYEVQAGDCLWKIAERFLGDGARYTDLAAWNEEQIQDPNLIYPGMVLRIMPDTEQGVKQNTDSNADRESDADADTETNPDTGTDSNTQTSQNAGTDMRDAFDETSEEMSIFGSISGHSWENEWLGMRFDAPEGFRLTPAEDYFDDLDEDEDDDDLLVYVEFVADSTEYLGTIAFLALAQSDDSPEEYMEEVKPIAEESFRDELGVDIEWSVEGTVEFGGRSFEHYAASSELWGYDICQDYYITKQEDIICFFYILSIDGMTKEPVFLLDGFSEYPDNSGDGDKQTEAQQEKTETDQVLVLTETMKSYDKDNTISSTTVYKNEYDEEGNRIRRTECNEDGDVTQRYEYEYDEKGNVTAETFTVEYMDVWEKHIYKEDGELLGLLEDDEDRPGNGAEARIYQWEYEYNEFDSVITKLYKSPAGEQELTLYEYIYDEADNIVKETTYSADPNDKEDKKLTGWTEYGYDEDNRVIESTTYDSEGVVQRSMTVEYTFDAAGNMTTTTRFGEDGPMMWFTTNRDEIAIDGGYRSSSGENSDMISRYEFDERGNYSRITDYFKSGNDTYYTVLEYEYVTI